MLKLMAVIAAAVAALVLTAAASAGETYTDSTGEVAGAVDITTVSVSNDPVAKTVTFAVTTNLTTAPDDNTFLAIPIDSDMNVTTGQGGFDYVVVGSNQGFAVVNETTSTPVPESGSVANGVWTVTVPAADIGNPLAFRFGVLTETGPDPNNPIDDVAPDTGVWLYALDQAPVTAPSPAPKPVVPQVSFVTPAYAGTPKAGKPFRISSLAVHLSTGTTVKATALRCTATLGGKHLAGSGTGGCTFRLPATAKGKKLVVHVKGKYRSVGVGGAYTFKVK